MLLYDFDTVYNRRGTFASKWDTTGNTQLPEDVLPLSLADMDFQSPPEIVNALQERVAHGFFGYTFDHAGLKTVVCERMKRLYNWDVYPDEVLFSPGVISGMSAVTQAVTRVGDGILMQTPVFGPFYRIAEYAKRTIQHVELQYVADDDNQGFGYQIDIDAFEAAAAQPDAQLFYLCNPHNPGGFVIDESTLTRLAEICQRHDVVICSDDIHCELLLGDTSHMPAAAISSEISRNVVTLISPSKSFNLAGLSCSIIIIQNDTIRTEVARALRGSDMLVNALGFEAAVAAYTKGDAWLTELRRYLTENRDFTIEYIQKYLPDIRHTTPDATYLLWLDCRGLPVDETPYDFFLQHARVAFTDGASFGKGGEGFVRLNFGCPRELLADGLQRIRAALYD